MTKKSFQGTGTALVTPFKQDGSIDEPAPRRLVDFQLREGIDTILPCGTASNIEPSTLLRLAELPHIVAVKESSGSLAQIMDIIHNRPRDFRVLAGDDYMAVAVTALGGDGVVSVVSNQAPGMMRSII